MSVCPRMCRGRGGWCERRCTRRRRQAIDSPTTPVEKLEHIATLLPPEWTAPAATGTPQQCVTTIREQLALGADGVILHGATTTELEPILAAY